MFSPLLSVWLGWKHRGVFWYYAIVCLVSDFLSYILKQFDIKHAIVSNLFIVAEFIIVINYFKLQLLPKRYFSIINVLLVLVVCLYVYSTLLVMGDGDKVARSYNYKAAAFFCMLYILFSLLGLYKIMKDMIVVKLEKSQLFLVCVAFLLYASGALLMLLAKDEIVKVEKDFFANAWPLIFLPLNVIKNLLLAIGIKNQTENAR